MKGEQAWPAGLLTGNEGYDKRYVGLLLQASFEGACIVPEMNTSKAKVPDPAEPFDQALIAAANEIQESSNLEPSDDLAEAAVIVLSEILSTTLEGAGTEHRPHPSGATTETASCAACLMAACLSGLSVNLKNQGIQLDVPAVFTRAGFTVFQWYRPEQQATIISSGRDAFEKLLETASGHPNVQEWIEDVQRLTAAYVLTGDRNYISLLRKEHLLLWQARDKGLNPGRAK
ncbi:MAG: hypothetical protein ACE5IQ_03260 [Candidatus Methylomirabilales bacterium]